MKAEIVTEESWPIDSIAVVAAVSERARALALELGLDSREAAAVAIAVSELAVNIAVHAGRGAVILRTVRDGVRQGVSATAIDDGPGIADIAWALMDGSSSRGSLGSGLPAARRLMDEFCIDSAVGRGTRVTVVRWAGATGIT